jgi:tetratricopeptide (TPR) repeat protein
MKQVGWTVVTLLVGALAACGARAPATPKSYLSDHPLETAKEYLIRGDSFSAIKDYAHAILDYDQAIRLNPEYAEAYNNRGYAYYWSGNPAHAIADYSRAIALRPNYAYAYNNRGAAYMASGHPDRAISDLDHALELQPEFPQAYINRGNAHLRSGHISLAFADFRQGGENPVTTIALLCGMLVMVILLGAFLMTMVRKRLLAKNAAQSK